VALLVLGFSSVYVLPLGSEIDELAASGVGVLNSFSLRTIKYVILSVSFCLFCWEATTMFFDDLLKIKITNFIYKSYLVIFALIILEFLLINLFGVDVRLIYNNIFGVVDNSLVSSFKLGNYYTAFGFWSEESSSIRILPFYFLILSKGIKSWRELIATILSFATLLCMRSTTGYILGAMFFIIFAFLFFFKHGMFPKTGYLFLIFAIVLIIVSDKLINSDYLQMNINKISNFISNNGSGSSYYRSSVILFNIKVFLERPLFGVGVGSCDCHGSLFSLLSNFGIIGTILYFNFLFNFSSKRPHLSFESLIKWLILLIFMIASFTISDLLSPLLISISFLVSLPNCSKREKFSTNKFLKLVYNF
jgi:hypothetical protein